MDEMLMYLIPLVIGLGGVIWYWKSNSNSTTKAQPVTAPSLQKPNGGATPRPPTTQKAKAPKVTKGDGVPLKIFFGSQTGTADDFSHKLAGEGKRFGFNVDVVDCEDYDWEDLKDEPFVMFVVATYGEGEPTDNARVFDEWLNGEHDQNVLSNVKFTVFGLGNKTYEHYNAMARKVDKRLAELGAQRVFKKGEGDDDASLEDDFAAWKRELWPALCEHFGLSMPANASAEFDRRFRVQFYDPKSPEATVSEKNSKLHLAKKSTGPRLEGTYDSKNPYQAKIVVNKELHGSTSDRSCRHVEIEIGAAFKYEAGDHLGVYPENQMALVEGVAKRLGVDLDSIFSMFPADKATAKPVLGPCTVRQALLQWVDITNPPRKNVIKVLSSYASDPNEKAKLIELSDDSKTQPYQSYIKDDQRTVLCLLEECPSVKIPFDHFIEIVPRLAPRYYSISSSLKEHPGKVHVTSVVVEFTTNANRKHKGVCSNWLAKQVPTSEPIPVLVFLEKANFRLPKDPKIPVIMVGPGTGLAPFRGFLHDRKHQLQSGPIGETVLFFGCRHPEMDYIYQQELLEAKEKGYLTHLFVAFSRAGKEKSYVQHKLMESAQEIFKLFDEKKAYFYVCGDARNMAKDVRQTLKQIVMQEGKKSEQEAEQYITDIQKAGRYQTDVWF